MASNLYEIIFFRTKKLHGFVQKIGPNYNYKKLKKKQDKNYETMTNSVGNRQVLHNGAEKNCFTLNVGLESESINLINDFK